MLKSIKAKYDSKCNETGKEIKKGETCYYNTTTKRIYCDSSHTADNYRMQDFNRCFNMPDSNY